MWGTSLPFPALWGYTLTPLHVFLQTLVEAIKEMWAVHGYISGLEGGLTPSRFGEVSLGDWKFRLAHLITSACSSLNQKWKWLFLFSDHSTPQKLRVLWTIFLFVLPSLILFLFVSLFASPWNLQTKVMRNMLKHKNHAFPRHTQQSPKIIKSKSLQTQRDWAYL